jgi:PAS domain S-box-containing protein
MNMNNQLTNQITRMQGRVLDLYRNVDTIASQATDLLPIALKELGVAMGYLDQQNKYLISTQTQLETKCQHYQTLFELTPDSYLVTNTAGTIKESNRTAASLLGIEPQLLVGNSLVSLVSLEDRSFFRGKLLQLEQQNQIEFSVRLQRCKGDPFDALLVGTAIRSSGDNSLVLHWLVRDVTERKRAEKALEQVRYNPCQDRPPYFCNRGETITLASGFIWLVSEGIIKLTTFSECGKEILVGFARNGMIFGSSLTAQPLYQAIALVDTKLVQIPLTEIGQSPRLAQALLPLINQRLHQTEGFVTILGQIRVEDRLNRLLQLLKQELGESIENGTRLCVRLTHQDFASACCTTRVTITRLLGKLQQEGKIAIDAQNRLIVMSETHSLTKVR